MEIANFTPISALVEGLLIGLAATHLGGLHTEALVFVPAMIAGMLIAQRVFGADRVWPSSVAASCG